MSSQTRFNILLATMSVAIAMSASATPVNGVGTQGLVPLAQQPTLLHEGDVAVGLLAVTQPMHIVVSLKLRNQAQLKSFLAKAQQPGTPIAQRTMSPEEFVTQFAPTSEQVQAVVSYLTLAGFKNISVAPNRQLVSADATADTVHAAFHTGFVHVQTHDGRAAYASTGGVMIPAALKDSVLSVLGLQTVHVFRTAVQSANPNVVHTNSVPGFIGHSPTDFATIYGGIGVPTASTIPVGIIAEGSMTNVLSDLSAFTTYYSLPTVLTQVVGSGSSDTSGDDEWDLDSQDIVGMSGGVKKLIFYDAASLQDSDITADINAAVSANATKTINVSLGECEIDAQSDGMAAATDQILEQAVVQGQTFSVSAGDSGASECGGGSPYPNISQAYPASSPYVVAVGGTALEFTNGTYYPGEEVWNSGSTEATGGGPSAFEPMPAWQVGVGQNAGQGVRGVPDVAFDGNPGSGAVIILHGQQAQYGGTSLSAPLFAGAWARMLAAKGSGFGFAAPLLYQLPADAFHDITEGGNNGETAANGWDYASGFGSLNMSQAVQDFNGPAANFKFTVSGPTVTFVDTSADWGGTFSAHAWNFGDGSTSSAANPSHTYATWGNYDVTEIVTDSVSGKSSSKLESLFTPGPSPVANFTYSLSGSYNATVSFYDESTDPNNSAVGITWNFGDGSTGYTFGVDTQIFHVYATGGSYKVTETVADQFFGGPSDSHMESLTLMPNTAPSLSAPTGGDSSYTVNWSSVPGTTSYILQQQFNGGDWITVENSTATSWLSSSGPGPTISGTYGYQVQACNIAGCGPWSSISAITVHLGSVVPPPKMAPTLNLPATSGTGSYTVMWSSVPGATSYNLQQYADGGPWRSTGHALGNSLTIRRKPSGTYAYRAQACNASGCGPWSDNGTIVVTAP